jgi:hypothetical protein
MDEGFGCRVRSLLFYPFNEILVDQTVGKVLGLFQIDYSLFELTPCLEPPFRIYLNYQEVNCSEKI